MNHENPDGVAEVTRSEEQLRVGTVRHPVERVRLSRRIVTELRQVEVEIRREELVVEREVIADLRDSDGPGASGTSDGEWPVQDELVIVLSQEVPIITMETQPYERVRVRVERVTEQRAVTEQVRREEVVVDDAVVDPT